MAVASSHRVIATAAGLPISAYSHDHGNSTTFDSLFFVHFQPSAMIAHGTSDTVEAVGFPTICVKVRYLHRVDESAFGYLFGMAHQFSPEWRRSLEFSKPLHLRIQRFSSMLRENMMLCSPSWRSTTVADLPGQWKERARTWKYQRESNNSVRRRIAG